MNSGRVVKRTCIRELFDNVGRISLLGHKFVEFRHSNVLKKIEYINVCILFEVKVISLSYSSLFNIS